MAIALLDFSATVGGTDLSDHLTKITLNVKADAADTTTFGSGGWRSRIGGLKDWSAALTFNQDFSASELDSILWPLLGTVVTFVGKPTSGAVSPTNPSYSGSLLVEEYTPFDSTVGDLAQLSVTWSGAGVLTRATA
ncbi:MAG TPA: hypothetical protein VIR27_16590 [Mycobacteriales bacterium]